MPLWMIRDRIKTLNKEAKEKEKVKKEQEAKIRANQAKQKSHSRRVSRRR